MGPDNTFRPTLPSLPPDVLAMLAPAIDAIGREARHGTQLVSGAKIRRAGEVAVRANGTSTYGPGFKIILDEVFGPALLRELDEVQAQGRIQVTPSERCSRCGDDNCRGPASCSCCCLGPRRCQECSTDLDSDGYCPMVCGICGYHDCECGED